MKTVTPLGTERKDIKEVNQQIFSLEMRENSESENFNSGESTDEDTISHN